MSLIYEALRKSEEERRLGEAPTLLGAEPASWRHAREELERRRRTRWLLLPPLVIGAIAAGWWVGRGADVPTPAAAPQPGVESVRGEGARALAPRAADPAPAATAPVAAAPGPEAADAEPQLPRTADDVAATEGVDPATLKRFEQGEVFANAPEQLRPVEATRETAVVPPEAALPAPLPDPQPMEPGVAHVPPPVPVPPAAAVAAATTPPAPVAAPPAPVAVETPAPAVDPVGVPSIHALPFGTRKELPPLVLSMHVYAQDPARRFVLIDDERMTEGTTSGDVRLREIRADGVVLEFRGQAFFVPRAGN